MLRNDGQALISLKFIDPLIAPCANPRSGLYCGRMTVVSEQKTLPPDTLARAQRDFEQALPRIEAHARIKFGRMSDPGSRDDFIQNTVGIGWKHWLSAIRHGKDPNEFVSTIAEMSVRHVRAGRRLDRRESARDTLSPRAQRMKSFTTQSLPDKPDSGSARNSTIDALRDNTHSTPPEQAEFREQWGMLLDEMGPTKGSIVEDMAAGEHTNGLAEKHRVSPGRISQIRREAERTWNNIDQDGEERGR
jgi:hypothetical protein